MYLNVLLSLNSQVILDENKKAKTTSEWCYSLKLNSSPVMSLVPGMMNQGDLVGNRKGLLLSGTQNGATVPWGMPKFTGGTTVAAAASWLSGKAFSGCLGTNGINKNNNINICTHTSSFITHVYIDFKNITNAIMSFLTITATNCLLVFKKKKKSQIWINYCNLGKHEQWLTI